MSDASQGEYSTLALQISPELENARRQIRKYEADIQAYEQQRIKAERTLQRLQTDYDAHISVSVSSTDLMRC